MKQGADGGGNQNLSHCIIHVPPLCMDTVMHGYGEIMADSLSLGVRLELMMWLVIEPQILSSCR